MYTSKKIAQSQLNFALSHNGETVTFKNSGQILFRHGALRPQPIPILQQPCCCCSILPLLFRSGVNK